MQAPVLKKTRFSGILRLIFTVLMNSTTADAIASSNKIKLNAVLILLVITQFVALVLAWRFELTDTEAYYWTWSIKPDLGYFDHPPMISWVLTGLTSIFGDSAFVIRLPALIGKLVSCYIFYIFCRKKLEESEISYAFLFVFSAPVLCMGTLLSIPDVLSVPLGLAALYFLDQGETRKGAVALGIGFLSKWSLMGLIPYFLYACWKRSKKELFIGVLIVIFLQIPVLVWNQQHDWATFYFQFFKRHSHGFLTFPEYLRNLSNYVGSQFFCFGIPLVIGTVAAFFKANNEQRKYFVWTAAPMFAISFLSAIQGQNRYYWACLNLFVMSIFIVQVFSKQIKQRSKPVWGILIFLIMTNWSLIIISTMLPVGYWFDQVTDQPNQYRHTVGADVTGWKNWSKTIYSEKINFKKMEILASDFHIAAQVTWALGPQYLNQIRPVGSAWEPHQFGFWSERSMNSDSVLLVADDRYDNLASLQDECEENVKWNRHEEKLLDKTIKVIFWSVCHKRKTAISALISE